MYIYVYIYIYIYIYLYIYTYMKSLQHMLQHTLQHTVFGAIPGMLCIALTRAASAACKLLAEMVISDSFPCFSFSLAVFLSLSSGFLCLFLSVPHVGC